MFPIFTSVFSFFGSVALGAPTWAYVVGLLCMLTGLFTKEGAITLMVPLYGLFLCIALNASGMMFLVGFVCVMADLIIAGIING